MEFSSVEPLLNGVRYSNDLVEVTDVKFLSIWDTLSFRKCICYIRGITFISVLFTVNCISILEFCCPADRFVRVIPG